MRLRVVPKAVLRVGLSYVWTIGLAVLLTACSGVSAPLPTKQLVQQAIALELTQTQAALSQQLRLGESPVTVDRVAIAEYVPLLIDELQSYRVRGSYDYTLKLPQRPVKRQQNPFEVYLQRQQEAKTWRLARLERDEDGNLNWVTQRVQP